MKFKEIITILIVTAGVITLFSACGPKVPQTYTNPIAKDAVMGDPFVVRYDDTYYLTGTTDSSKGFRVWTSKNMVDWEAKGFAFEADENTWGKSNFWAPEMFKYGDKYYMAYSVAGEGVQWDFRLCLAVSDKPEGPYKDLYAPWCDLKEAVIDADVFIDDNGSAYLYYAKVGSVDYPKHKLLGDIYGVKLKGDLSGMEGKPALMSKPIQEWETPEDGMSLCNEGPFVFREGDMYYMTYSANNYQEPFYGIGYSTAQSPLGPWNKSEHNPILTQNKGSGVSGPGHSCITTSPDGKEKFIVYHTHQSADNPEGNRVVNIDRISIDEAGNLSIQGPTRTAQPIPAGGRREIAD